MSIVVYSLDEVDDVHVHHLGANELVEALAYAERMRKLGRRHVSISTELPDSVGKPGVADVLPGYDWKKRRT